MRVRNPQPTSNPAPSIHDAEDRARKLAERIAGFRRDADDPDLREEDRKDARRMANELAADLRQLKAAARIEDAA